MAVANVENTMKRSRNRIKNSSYEANSETQVEMLLAWDRTLVLVTVGKWMHL